MKICPTCGRIIKVRESGPEAIHRMVRAADKKTSGNKAGKNAEAVNMKGRIGLIGVVALLFVAASVLFGCSTVGNGKVDPFGVEISLEYHDNFGNGFTFVGGELTEATYRSIQTGVLYQYTEATGKGTFLVTAPDGKTKVRLRRAFSPAQNE